MNAPSTRTTAFLFLVTSIVVVAAGCPNATTLSADEHRARASEERARAAEHDARYDESARAIHLETPAGDVALAAEEYNPTHYEHEAAEAHTKNAQRHLDAAHELEASEDKECVGLSSAARVACPLFTPLAVEDVAKGVRVTFRDADTAAHAAQIARCQQAFARTRGFKDMPTCALFGKNLAVSQHGAVVELTAADAAGVARIRSNVRAHQAPSGNSSSQ